MTLGAGLQQAAALLQAGRLQEAIGAFGSVLRQHPTAVEPRLGIARALQGLGDGWAAAAWLSDACRVAPAREELWLDLAQHLAAQGRDAEIEPALATGLAMLPRSVRLLRAMGESCLRRAAWQQGAEVFGRVCELQPGDAAALLNRGFCLEQCGAVDQAIDLYRQALAARPGFMEAHVDLAGILWRVGDFDGSLAHARQALKIAPDNPFALRIVGTALLNLNRAEEAQHWLRQALERQPGFALAEIDLAFALLLQGRMHEGWKLYGQRWRDAERMKRPTFFDPAHEWRGPREQPLAGRRIAVYAEQGLGDVLQFIRYIDLLQQEGASVSCVIQHELVALVEHSFPGVQCLVPGRTLEADHHVALLDLPMHFGTTLEHIPARIPYLAPPPAAVQAWAGRLPDAQGRMRVGFAWCGSPAQVNDRNRSMHLSELAPLMSIEQIQCFSLQKAGAGGFTDIEPPTPLVDLTAQWADFADSAALISQLDLVITVDTAIAHLAGGLGKEVWVMLPPNADWRYLLEREDSPWYPSMRLFRRAFGEGRESQVARVEQALRARIGLPA